MLDQLIVWVMAISLLAIIGYLIRRNAQHRETQRQLQRDIDALISRKKTEDEIRKMPPDDRRRSLDQWMRDKD